MALLALIRAGRMRPASGVTGRRPRWRLGIATLALAAAVTCIGAAGCGSKPPPPPPAPVGGTPAGFYTITVSAASPSGGGLSHSVQIALEVQ